MTSGAAVGSEYKGWMSAGESDIEERILMTRTEYSF
jgi:hypothetical protein